MTFDEWFVQRFSNPDDECYAFPKEAWNAAIEAALAAWNEVDADDIACLKSS